MAQDSRYLGSARVIACCTFASRITGLARDVVLNHVYGQGWVQDAYNYGFLIPNLFRRLFGEGALSAVFVPTFTDVLDKRGQPVAWLLLGRVAGFMALGLAILTILLELGVLAVWHFAPGGQMRSLQIGLTAVMMPFMVGVCMLALFSSILNCVQHFTVPALLPCVLNIMIIIGVLAVGPAVGDALEEQIYGVAVCVLVASVIQLAIIMPVLRAHGVRFRLSSSWTDPELRHMGRTFLPVLLGQGVLLFNVFFDAQICTFLTQGPEDPATGSFLAWQFKYPLEEGALSAVNNAQRLYQFPLGVLAISLATAAFPLFSLYASRGEMGSLRSSVAQSLRLAVFVGLPSGVIMILLAEPIVSLLFQHGRFGPEQTLRAARVLQWYGLGMTAFCCQHILLRAFYSLKDTLTPMWISCYLVSLSIAMNLTLVWHAGIREMVFGISTTIASCLHVCISVWLLRRRMEGRIGARAIAASVGRTVVASAVAGLAAWALLRWTAGMDASGVGTTGARAAQVFGPLIGAVLAYLATARLLGMEEVRWLLSRHRPPL
ncbi:MAG: murein biosynthesis integral membrane protein MurJ [Phycisphaerae bacterium]|nr:murein biosynthesis integral membrane protein MurJ [Phycisphaerae bacterium]